MALIRSQAETILISRTEALLAELSMSGAADGHNSDLNDSLGWALMKLSIQPTDVTSVVDADLASLSTDDYSAFLDLAELRLLQTIYQNFILVNRTVGPRSESYDQLGQRIAKAIELKRQSVKEDYGIGLGTMEAGVITLDFQSKEDDSTYLLGG